MNGKRGVQVVSGSLENRQSEGGAYPFQLDYTYSRGEVKAGVPDGALDHIPSAGMKVLTEATTTSGADEGLGRILVSSFFWAVVAALLTIIGTIALVRPSIIVASPVPAGE